MRGQFFSSIPALLPILLAGCFDLEEAERWKADGGDGDADGDSDSDGDGDSDSDSEGDQSVGSVLDVALGRDHSCALLQGPGGGVVRCWGRQDDGRLGTLELGDALTDEPWGNGLVEIDAPVWKISAGAAHTCAIANGSATAGGSVYCWGLGLDGRLGYGNEASIGDDESPASVGPVPLLHGALAIDVAAGGAHTCAVLLTGEILCWGRGAEGQLGYGDTGSIGDDPADDPLPWQFGGDQATAIAAGEFHNCVIGTDNDGAYCWGLGLDGRLGYGNTQTLGDDMMDQLTTLPALGIAEVDFIAAGAAHTCAIAHTGLEVTCWGAGGSGRLGLGHTLDIGDDGGDPFEMVAPWWGGEATLRIAAGDAHTCLAVVGESVRCWGEGDNGRLGTGSTADIGDDETPEGANAPVDFEAGIVPLGIAAGGRHSCAIVALATDQGHRKLRCWGAADFRQIGYPNMEDIGDNESVSVVGDLKLWCEAPQDCPGATCDPATGTCVL
jgi:alpha-tubulin suppressor-like RCC1 family protein